MMPASVSSTDPAPRRATIARALNVGVIVLLRIYQYTLSLVFPPSCRYTPSCSEYAIDAVRAHGTGRGAWLAVGRIARCHPWGGCGYDPVPGASIEYPAGSGVPSSEAAACSRPGASHGNEDLVGIR